MDKTITAEFPSADAAGFAAKQLRDHFPRLHGVRLFSQAREQGRSAGPAYAPLALAGTFDTGGASMGMSMQPGAEGGLLPLAALNAADYREDVSRGEAKAWLSVTAPAELSAQISSVLYSGGGLHLKEC